MSKLDEILRSRGALPAKAANLANQSAPQPVPPRRDSQHSQDSQGADSHLRNSSPAPQAAAVGRAVTCSACRHFQPRPSERPDGWCGKFAAETWTAVPFACDGFEQSQASRRLEGRRQKVVGMLRADSALKYSFDVLAASPIGAPAGPVSVMFGLRDSSGQIVTGELAVPADKWDMVSFIRYWDEQGRPT